MKLKEGIEPELTYTVDMFREHIEDGKHMGVPVEYFKIEGDTVKMSYEVAKKIDWNIDEEFENVININALPQEITLDGETIKINPGYWCSNVPPDAFK